MKNHDRIRSTGTIPLVLIFTAALVAPLAMLMAFPRVTRDTIARVMNFAVEAAQPAEAAAAEPMVFEPTVITLAEADATVAAQRAIEQAAVVEQPRPTPSYDAERGLMPYDVVDAVPAVANR